MSESRRYRREMAKKFGLLSKKETYSQMSERYKRSIEMGNMIHTQHLQDMKNREIYGEEEISPEKSDLEITKDTNYNENPYGFLGKR